MKRTGWRATSMRRRDFLTIGAQAAAAGSVVSLAASAGPAAVSSASAEGAPAIVNRYTAEDHRRRLRNIGACRRGVRSCLKQWTLPPRSLAILRRP